MHQSRAAAVCASFAAARVVRCGCLIGGGAIVACGSPNQADVLDAMREADGVVSGSTAACSGGASSGSGGSQHLASGGHAGLGAAPRGDASLGADAEEPSDGAGGTAARGGSTASSDGHDAHGAADPLGIGGGLVHMGQGGARVQGGAAGRGTGAASSALVNAKLDAGNPGVWPGSAAAEIPGWARGSSGVVVREANHARSQPLAVKMFGEGPDVSLYQELPAMPGEYWMAGCFIQHISSDRLQGTAAAYVRLEFRDAAGQLIGPRIESADADQNTPTDSYLHYAAEGMAPAGTSAARITLRYRVSGDPAQNRGAGWYDDAYLVRL